MDADMEKCEWSWDEELDLYSSGCDGVYPFIQRHDLESGNCTFCPKCGRRIAADNRPLTTDD